MRDEVAVSAEIGAGLSRSRSSTQIEVASSTGARVEIDAVGADADRISEDLRSVPTEGMSDVLLEDRELCPDPAGLSNVGRLREAIDGLSDDIWPQSQARISLATIRPRRLRLKPVEEAQAQLAGGFQAPDPFESVDTADGSEPVIVLRPVDDGRVAGGETVQEVTAVEDAPKTPPGVIVLRLEQVSSQRVPG